MNVKVLHLLELHFAVGQFYINKQMAIPGP